VPIRIYSLRGANEWKSERCEKRERNVELERKRKLFIVLFVRDIVRFSFSSRRDPLSKEKAKMK